MTVYVYGLRADERDPVKYVGRAKNPVNRISGHTGRGAARRVREWTASLAQAPELIILQECATEPEAQIAERFWISKLRNDGVRLLNSSWGGEQPTGSRPRRALTGLGVRVRSLRAGLGMNQRQLGRLAGIPQPNLCRIESGERDAGIQATTAVRLARALGTTVEFLVTGEISGSEKAEAS
jgi:DNA-binding XRE family transcriptional regulator